MLTAIIINHVGLNMADDYYDYKHSVDTLKPGEKNPYTGGSGTLSSGLVTSKGMFRAFVLCFLVTASVGFYLTLERGLLVLVFGLIGVFCSLFYTAPPISLSHRGLGELALLINFGTTIGLGSYFVQAQRLSVEAFVATLPMGIMLFSMIVINEIPDLEEDKKAGKLTLVARYGRKNGVKLYILSWVFTYSIIIGAVVAQIMPALTLISLFPVPLVYRSIKILRIHHEDPLRLAPANLDMIKAHGVTCLGIIGGYSLWGVINGAEPSQLAFILVLLVFSYAPAAASLLRRKRK